MFTYYIVYTIILYYTLYYATYYIHIYINYIFSNNPTTRVTRVPDNPIYRKNEGLKQNYLLKICNGKRSEQFHIILRNRKLPTNSDIIKFTHIH